LLKVTEFDEVLFRSNDEVEVTKGVEGIYEKESKVVPIEEACYVEAMETSVGEVGRERSRSVDRTFVYLERFQSSEDVMHIDRAKTNLRDDEYFETGFVMTNESIGEPRENVVRRFRRFEIRPKINSFVQ